MKHSELRHQPRHVNPRIQAYSYLFSDLHYFYLYIFLYIFIDLEKKKKKMTDLFRVLQLIKWKLDKMRK